MAASEGEEPAHHRVVNHEALTQHIAAYLTFWDLLRVVRASQWLCQSYLSHLIHLRLRRHRGASTATLASLLRRLDGVQELHVPDTESLAMFVDTLHHHQLVVPVRVLTIGDFSVGGRVDVGSLASAMQAGYMSALRGLELRFDETETIRPLLTALAEGCCPHLEKICLFSMDVDEREIGNLGEALEKRARHGNCVPLKQLGVKVRRVDEGSDECGDDGDSDEGQGGYADDQDGDADERGGGAGDMDQDDDGGGGGGEEGGNGPGVEVGDGVRTSAAVWKLVRTVHTGGGLQSLRLWDEHGLCVAGVLCIGNDGAGPPNGTLQQLTLSRVWIYEDSSIPPITREIRMGYWRELRMLRLERVKFEPLSSLSPLLKAVGDPHLCPYLHTLVVEGVPESCSTTATVMREGGFRSLSALEFWFGRVSDDEIKSLAEAFRSRHDSCVSGQVEVLRLVDGFTADGWRHLTDVLEGARLIRLRELQVAVCQIGDEGYRMLMTALEAGAGEELIELNTTDVNITADGLITLVDALKRGACPKLLRIHLDSNPAAMTIRGVKALGEVLSGAAVCSKRLADLTLGSCQLDDDRVELLAQSLLRPESAQLRLIALNTNRGITDEGVIALLEAFKGRAGRCLIEFGVDLTSVTQRGFEAVADAVESGHLPSLVSLGSQLSVTTPRLEELLHRQKVDGPVQPPASD